MKKLILILSLFLLTGCAGMTVDKASMVDPIALAGMVEAKYDGFRNSKWDMTPEEVMAADGVVGEITKVLDETKIKVVGGTQERPIVTTYKFASNKLEWASVSVENIQSDREAKATYGQAVKDLTKIYGKPYFKDRYITSWHYGDTSIDITNTFMVFNSPAYSRKELVTEQRSDGRYVTTERSVGYGQTTRSFGGKIEITAIKTKPIKR